MFWSINCLNFHAKSLIFELFINPHKNKISKITRIKVFFLILILDKKYNFGSLCSGSAHIILRRTSDQKSRLPFMTCNASTKAKRRSQAPKSNLTIAFLKKIYGKLVTKKSQPFRLRKIWLLVKTIKGKLEWRMQK